MTGQPARPPSPAPIRGRPLAIWELLVIVAGMALAFWLFAKELRDFRGDDLTGWVTGLAIFLSGLSVVGPPILLARRWRSGVGAGRRRWGPGRLLWFFQGTSAWLMWPPIIAARVRQQAGAGGPAIRVETPQICYFYGTPLMAVYVVVALLAAGWLRPRRRRRRPADWRERFGLALGLAWFALGLVVLGLIYSERLR